jgi:hypothetical protein
MSEHDNAATEITPAYRTLDEPTKLLGLSVGQWGALAVAGGIAYAVLLASPLPWRVNVSLVAILGGGPLVLLLLRENGALSPGRLFAAVLRWRMRPALLLEVSASALLEDGAVVLDEPLDGAGPDESGEELPWPDQPNKEKT